jgi:hypothetical protein
VIVLYQFVLKMGLRSNSVQEGSDLTTQYVYYVRYSRNWNKLMPDILHLSKQTCVSEIEDEDLKTDHDLNLVSRYLRICLTAAAVLSCLRAITRQSVYAP